MTAITLNRPRLGGCIAAIPAKAEAHRALICAALCQEPTLIVNPGHSGDVAATCRVLTALGAGLTDRGQDILVAPGPLPPVPLAADCGESGSTLRFLLPVAAALGAELTLTCQGRLSQRPLAPLTEQLAAHGVTVESSRSIHCAGQLSGGAFTLPGNISSQFASGLLLALSRLGGTLELTGAVESRPYIEMTGAMLGRFGSDVQQRGNRFQLTAAPYLRSPGCCVVGGDWSDAAFYLAAGLLGQSPVTVSGLAADSPQGDKEILPLLRLMGGKLVWEEKGLTAYPSPLRAITINASQQPDLVPILAVAASAAQGVTQISQAGRLRLKESDRLAGITALLQALGGRVRLEVDSLFIQGGPLSGGQVDSCRDHRLVMAAALAASLCAGPATISDPEAVTKSHPSFWEDFRRLDHANALG